MIVFPKAKINIGLRITGKRDDGYHNIETLFYPVAISDALEFVVSDESGRDDILSLSGINTGGKIEDNLIIKTINRLREEYSFPILKIHLHKAIPVGAGLGGGSSDAACMLKSINRCFGLNIERSKLMSIALDVGSDCPFFIDFVPSYAEGRGELLKEIKPVLSGYYILLLNPGIEINTREAFSNCDPGITSTNLNFLANRPVEEWKELIINDFEDYAFRKHPEIGKLKDELYILGALFSSMSGSGSSVFGIFKEKPEVPELIRNWVIWEGIL